MFVQFLVRAAFFRTNAVWESGSRLGPLMVIDDINAFKNMGSYSSLNQDSQLQLITGRTRDVIKIISNPFGGMMNLSPLAKNKAM